MALKKSSNVRDELAKVSEQIDEEELRHLDLDTPVADEEGVVRNVPLLAGYIDKEGTLHDTFSYREMTGKDEEAISKTDIRSNGAKLINTLCERCVISIGTIDKKEVGSVEWAKIIRSMCGGDLDYMAFKIRELSKGKEVQFTHQCPNCKQKLITVVQTDEFAINPFLGQFEIPFTLHKGIKDIKGEYHKTGIIRLPNGYDREVVTPIIRKNPSTATTTLLAKCVKFDDGIVATVNSLNEMSVRDRDILENIIKENTFGLDTKIEGIVCDSCGSDLSGEIGESNFF